MTKKLPRFKKDRCYLIKFLDHASSSKEIMKIQVVGWVIAESDQHVTISAWKVTDTDQETINNNYEPVSIVKSCITGKKLVGI